MRIIAGSRKGARIFAPKGRDTRPTGDRVREAVFNLVGPVDGLHVLDLYAGSGAMGLEALSRGAESATFVEADRAAAETIVKNLEKLGLSGATVLREEAARKVATDAAAGRRYDLVLIDPPTACFLAFCAPWALISRRSSRPTASSSSSRMRERSPTSRCPSGQPGATARRA